MKASGTPQLSPEVVLVPPPEGPGVPAKRIRAIVCACIFGTSASLLLFVAGGMPVWVGALAMAPVLLVVAVLVTLRRWQLNRAHEALRQAFLAKHPPDEADPLVMAMGRAWKEPDRVPKTEDVRQALVSVENATRSGSPNEKVPGRATVVCFGELDIPEVGELHFEPEIVTPTGAVWRRLIWLAIAGAPITWCLLDGLHLLPSWLPGARALLGGFMYFFVAGAIALAVWIWKGMIRPTYIRMAPGVIQVLEYRFWKPKPAIRSYPMEPGTLALLTRIRKRLILTLSRGDHQDVISFSEMQQPAQRIERVWQALLSTAPTPPLNKEELVG